MPEPPLIEHKARLRKHFRARRRAVSPARRDAHDAAIVRHLDRSPQLRAARRLAVYLAFDGEPDLARGIAAWRRAGMTLAVPRLQAIDPGMQFVSWPENAALDANGLGIAEPVGTLAVAVAELDLVLCPLVAFAPDGARLGMGAGYYDRVLADVRDAAVPLRVGIAYEAQRADSLPMEATDIPLHAVVTEAGWFTCRR